MTQWNFSYTGFNKAKRMRRFFFLTEIHRATRAKGQEEERGQQAGQTYHPRSGHYRHVTGQKFYNFLSLVILEQR